MSSKSSPIHILSLGAGVQSSTIALMAALGQITPMPIAAIFADTQSEPDKVYKWLDWLEKQLPFPVYRVTAGNLEKDSLILRVSKKTGQTYTRTLIPAFIDKGDGRRGILGRKCTAEYKVRAIDKQSRQIIKPILLEWRRRHRKEFRLWAKQIKAKLPFDIDDFNKMQDDAICIQWIGISSDEPERIKDSRDPWKRMRWPLIELNMTREDCLNWMKQHGYPEPPRSACRFCPFHSDEEWKKLKTEEPEEFAKVIVFEQELQRTSELATGTAKLQGRVYLHGSLNPIDEVVFKNMPAKSQVNLFGNDCEGLCGV